MLNIDTTIFVGFLIINLVVGLYYARGVKTVREYAIGDRNFSTATITATIIATWIGSGFFYSAVSETYKEGLWHLIARFGDVLTLLIVAYTIAPKIGKFLGKISVAEIMGDLYGKKVRFITAISSILLSIGYVAVQIKALTELFDYFFNVSSIYATFFAILVITIYSTVGGIRAVTLTDIIQFFTFGVFVPVLAIYLWNSFDNPVGSVIKSTINNPAFSIGSVFNLSEPKFYSFFILFFYYTIPGLDPATVQRILMAKDVYQVRKSFSLAAFFCFIIGGTACVIGVTMLAHNPNLDPDNLIIYVIDNYAYTGLKGLSLVGITAMIMSSADSYINSAAVIFTHDLIKTSRYTLSFSRIFSVFVPVVATALALYKTNLYDLLLLAGNFYTPIITMPLMLAIFGFRTSSRVALTAILAGALTVIIWRMFIQSIIGIDSIIPGTIVNLLTMIFMHYALNESGGWVNINIRSDVNQTIKEKRNKIAKYFSLILPLKVIEFNLMSFHKLHKPKLKTTYIYAVFSVISTVIIILSIDRTIYNQHFHLINILLGIVLFIATSLICQKLWSNNFREKHLGLLWLMSIFIISSFINSIFVLISNFTHISLVVLILNLTMIGILLIWQLTLIMTVLGIISSFIFYQQYIGNIHISVENDLKTKLICIFFMISTFLIAFLKPKQEEQELNEEIAEHLSHELEYQYNMVSDLAKTKQTFIRNLQHETNTPVTGIYSMSQALNDCYDKLSEEERKKAINTIMSSSERLISYVNNLVDVSKLSNLSKNLNIRKVNLSNLTQEVVRKCRKLYIPKDKEDDREINVHIKPDLYASCDEYYIRKSYENIIINAIQYCKKGNIDITLAKELDRIKLIVKDSGIGIPEGEENKIFEPFEVSSKTLTPAGGRGMGLTLVKAVAEAHKGSVSVKSEGDSGGSKGSTFVFEVGVDT